MLKFFAEVKIAEVKIAEVKIAEVKITEVKIAKLYIKFKKMSAEIKFFAEVKTNSFTEVKNVKKFFAGVRGKNSFAEV